MSTSPLIALMVASPITAAILLNLAHGNGRSVKFTAYSFGLLSVVLPFATEYGNHIFSGHGRIAGLATGIIYIFSAHTRILAFILALIAYLMILAYTNAFKKVSGTYLAFMMLGVGATSATLFADDFFNFYVFLEIALISQTALAIAKGSLESIKASIKYLLVANIAGNCLLLGIAMLLSLTGSLNITDMQEAIATKGFAQASNPVFLGACALSVFAFAYASGLFPFHNIKSELYAAAAEHGSALMQTQTKFIMVGLGLIILRLFHEVQVIRYLMLYMALGAMVFGVIMALKQDNYHRMLSYHAISQAGYVAAGLSIGTPAAIIAGIFHAINHVLYKSALFLGCECVKIQKGTTDFKRLGSMITGLPMVGVLVLGAKFAISGIPPFNGFQSKLQLMVAAFDAQLYEVTVVMILVSVLTFISMMKASHLVFLRPTTQAEKASSTKRIPKSYLFALTVLVGLCLYLGLMPECATRYLEPIAYEVGYMWS